MGGCSLVFTDCQKVYACAPLCAGGEEEQGVFFFLELLVLTAAAAAASFRPHSGGFPCLLHFFGFFFCQRARAPILSFTCVHGAYVCRSPFAV